MCEQSDASSHLIYNWSGFYCYGLCGNECCGSESFSTSLSCEREPSSLHWWPNWYESIWAGTSCYQCWQMFHICPVQLKCWICWGSLGVSVQTSSCASAANELLENGVLVMLLFNNIKQQCIHIIFSAPAGSLSLSLSGPSRKRYTLLTSPNLGSTKQPGVLFVSLTLGIFLPVRQAAGMCRSATPDPARPNWPRSPAWPKPNPSSSAVSCLLGLSACQPLWKEICFALWPCRKHARASHLAHMWGNVTVWLQQKVLKHTDPILFSGDLSSVRGEHSCSANALWRLLSFRLRWVESWQKSFWAVRASLVNISCLFYLNMAVPDFVFDGLIHNSSLVLSSWAGSECWTSLLLLRWT